MAGMCLLTLSCEKLCLLPAKQARATSSAVHDIWACRKLGVRGAHEAA